MNSLPPEVTRSVTPLSAAAARQVGPYELVGRLGIGGLAEIFLARQPLVGGRLCVLKRIRPELGDDPAAVKMFFEEARVGIPLDHPNIARVLDCHHSPQASYLVTEWVSGVSVRELLVALRQREAFLEAELVAQLIHDCAQALHAAHTARGPDGSPLEIVHRDVSPQHLLVSRGGVVKVIDFGLAQTGRRVSSLRRSVIKGEARYLSPEQLRAEPLDIRSDLYSLGLVMYELLTNTRALPERTELELLRGPSCDIVPIEAHRAGVPVQLRFICWKLISMVRDERFATPRALLKVLKAHLPLADETARRLRLGEHIERVLAQTSARLNVGVRAVSS